MKGIIYFLGTFLFLVSSIHAQLAAPERLWARWLVSESKAVITWNQVAGADSYEVLRFNEGTGNWEFAARTTAPLFREPSHSGAKYAVRAESAVGVGALAETIVPAVPANYFGFTIYFMYPRMAYTTATNALIGFSVSHGGTDGILEIGRSQDTLSWIETIPTMVPYYTFNVTNLQPATEYWVRMTWADTNGIAGAYNFRMFTDSFYVPYASGQTVEFSSNPMRLVLNGWDVDGPSIQFRISTPPTRGTLSPVTQLTPWTAEVYYTAQPGPLGNDSFQFVVNDGLVDSVPATVTIANVTLNARPVALGANYTLMEDSPLEIALQGSDPDAEPLTFRLVSGPAHGILTGTPPNLIYTPATNFIGTDSFTFVARDGERDSLPATISLSVSSVDDPPVGVAGVTGIYEDQGISITLSASDVDGGPKVWEIVEQPANGVLSGTPPNLVYLPSTNFFGTDVFKFRVGNGVLFSAPATFAIFVSPVDDRPVAVPMTLTTLEDEPITFTVGISDVDGGPTLALRVATFPPKGSVNGATLPNLTYRPWSDFNGTDTFLVQAGIGYEATTPALITIHVLPVDDPPIAVSRNLTATQNVARTIVLQANDVDGGPIQWGIVRAPAHGTLTGVAPNLTYKSDSDFGGTDTFRFSVGGGSEAEVSIFVTAPPYVVTPIPNQIAGIGVNSLSIDVRKIFADRESPNWLNVTVATSDAALVSPSIDFGFLNLQISPTTPGVATITLRGTDLSGLYTDLAFTVTVRRGPAISVIDAGNTEGSSSGVVFNIRLSEPSTNSISVAYATGGGSAAAGVDFTPVSGVVTFAPGVTNWTVKVSTLQDVIDEIDETFTFALSDPVNAFIERGQAVGTIVDNDTANLAVQDITVTEGTGGRTLATFTVTLSTASDRAISVNYATADLGGLNAQAGLDYIARAGTVNFPAGSTAAQTVSIELIGDTMDEPAEAFSFLLSGAVNAGLSRPTGRCTINDDDAPPIVTIGNASVVEGNSSTRNLTFTATLSEPSATRVRVQFVTADGTATAGTDYNATSGEIVFDAGVTVRTFTLVVRGDVTPEPVETILVNFSSSTPTLVTLGTTQAVGSILSEE